MFILQEKKAHENWVAARQAERRLTEVIILTTGQLDDRGEHEFDKKARC